MIMTAAILTILFGIIGVVLLFKYLLMSINKEESILMVFSMLINSVAAGIWYAGSWSAYLS